MAETVVAEAVLCDACGSDNCVAVGCLKDLLVCFYCGESGCGEISCILAANVEKNRARMVLPESLEACFLCGMYRGTNEEHLCVECADDMEGDLENFTLETPGDTDWDSVEVLGKLVGVEIASNPLMRVTRTVGTGGAPSLELKFRDGTERYLVCTRENEDLVADAYEEMFTRRIKV